MYFSADSWLFSSVVLLETIIVPYSIGVYANWPNATSTSPSEEGDMINNELEDALIILYYSFIETRARNHTRELPNLYSKF